MLSWVLPQRHLGWHRLRKDFGARVYPAYRRDTVNSHIFGPGMVHPSGRMAGSDKALLHALQKDVLGQVNADEDHFVDALLIG